MSETLNLRGVRQNNLKNVNLDLPLGKTIIVTGPSGSGKSSLAFETIYAEGQRRYMQSLSTYARQFMEKFQAPDVDKIQNIPPTVAVEQINPVRNSRATVGTSTELYDYLRLLFEKIGVEYCHGKPMERLSLDEIYSEIAQTQAGKTILVCFSKKMPAKKPEVTAVLEEHLREGTTRMILGDEIVKLDSEPAQKCRNKEVAFVLDRLRMPEDPEDSSTRIRLKEALQLAMDQGGRFAHIFTEQEGKKYREWKEFTTLNYCRKCKQATEQKAATSFSFNSPIGACETCKGFGNILTVDKDLAIPNPGKSISQGAVEPFTKPSLVKWQKKLLEFCKKQRIDIDLPFKDLPKGVQKAVFEGTKGFKGVKGVFEELEREKYKMRIRVFISRYNSPFICPDCDGARLKDSVLEIKVGELNIAEVCNLTLEECRSFFRDLKLTAKDKAISEDIFQQIDRRLDYLNTVGLGYLNLSRLSRSLSGGEYQRILLSTQLSQGLTDTMYVLDEPSIGLHPKDTKQLLSVLSRLRERGNTLLLVEHDPEIIEWGEHIVDLGPGAGTLGGSVVFSGSRRQFDLANCSTAISIKEWRQKCRESMESLRPKEIHRWLEIKGASAHNLKNIDVSFPLNRLVVVTGVSGSGKSTLVVDTLYRSLAKLYHSENGKIGRFRSIAGTENLTAVELIDQAPIGKSSRSNPVTFMKAYDEIRSLFANTRQAVGRKLTPGHFSFNVAGGRCDECDGEGRVRIDMVFMEDIWISCPLCEGKRFKPTILEIRYRGKNIHEVLNMTVEESFRFFEDSGSLRTKLAILQEVGLGYIQLGQPSFTLSGGEAQRLKVARELTRNSSKRQPTLFILDEPTTGLHFNEVHKLIHVLKRLVASGHSVVVIEHNLQLICAAQHVIDLGPDGGTGGGSVVGFGTPLELSKKDLPYTARYLAEIFSH